MARKISGAGQRLHKKEMMLNDQELAQFNQARRASGLAASEFMRQRCLHITRHKRVALSQIQIYQVLGVLQQQCEEILVQMQAEAPTENSGVNGGKRNEGSQLGPSRSGTVEHSDVLAALEHHLKSIKSLRQQVARLGEPDADAVTGEP